MTGRRRPAADSAVRGVGWQRGGRDAGERLAARGLAAMGADKHIGALDGILPVFDTIYHYIVGVFRMLKHSCSAYATCTHGPYSLQAVCGGTTSLHTQ